MFKNKMEIKKNSTNFNALVYSQRELSVFPS
jgi:hypothetical protein